jgi:malto-oligosyltrehalose trehalohydrolase
MPAAVERQTTRREYRFGPRWLQDGRVEFRMWAPGQARVRLRIDGRESVDMMRDAEGWHRQTLGPLEPGTRYEFQLDDGTTTPDPASRYQPDDVHGPSELVADEPFSAGAWRGRAWEELVFYEVHVGTFTPEGTFRAAVDKLDHLASLGVTAVQLMPIADFAGTRGWGYDGVKHYAIEAAYGRPEDLRRFVAAAHTRGIAVFLDIVYNHFGPEGNYLPKLAPAFFTDRHKTPWGAGINYDGDDARPVRDYFIENVLFWLTEYGLDGFRFDAVDTITDDSEEDLLYEIARRVREEFAARQVHLVLENGDNEAHFLRRSPGGDALAFTAQWNDDLHHVLHVAATGEGGGYYSEYLGNTALLARSLAEGFAFQGEVMKYRGRARGEPSDQLPPTAFVSFVQNHDQVGNRAFGERLGALAPPHKHRAVACVYLLAPQIPMLFMGEEWNALDPFYYFCDFAEPLASAVRDGRRAEFARFAEFSDPVHRERIPDPLDPATFEACRLHWDDAALPAHADWLRWYKRALSARRTHVQPRLRQIRRAATWQVLAPGAIFVNWNCGEAGRLRVAANLSDVRVEFPVDRGRVFWHEGEKPDDATLLPWSVRWTTSSRPAGRA